MDTIRSILATYEHTGSYKASAKRLRVSKNTVKRYIRLAVHDGRSICELLKLHDEALSKVFYSSSIAHESTREQTFTDKLPYWIKELDKVGVSRHVLWEEYKSDHADGYGYSQFCLRLRAYIKSKHLTLAMDHRPADRLMLDFAGKKIAWYDKESGQEYWSEVLVGVLPHSQYTYAIALPDQKTQSFVHGVVKTLEYIGGVPKYILSDNLKAYVIKADRYEPRYNELTVQLAQHYGVDLQSTRSYKPKDKASVENMVSTVYSRLYAPLRDRIFHSIEQINEAFIQLLAQHNRKPFQKRVGSRQSVYEGTERALLKALPPDRFELKKQTKAKIQNNYHILLGEDKQYYSVPHQYVGQYVEVVYTARKVEIYLKGKGIALHDRLLNTELYRYSTQVGHQPASHRIYQQIDKYNDSDYIDQAKQIGEYTHWAIDYILNYQPNKDQAYKSALGILRLGKSMGYERLEKACQKCKTTQYVSYKMIQTMLHKNMEQTSMDGMAAPSIEHDNIRGAQAFS